MRKIVLSIFMLCMFISLAQDDTLNEDVMSLEEVQKVYDSINSGFTYEKGLVTLDGGMATINVPQGYKFLNAKQSKKVLTDYWGNPPSDPLGMLFPENLDPLSDNLTYAVEITYSEEGYINDEDAKDIDYDELLEEMKEDTKLGNPERIKLGYGSMDMIGWASEPYYDDVEKKLHWAKELKFQDSEINTLNYNIRVLGRKGYLNLNVIGDITVLPLVKEHVSNIVASAAFTDGNTYSDFNPDMDEVAAYGIGGLIAGKVLAKAGFFALILKFWKIIALGVAGVFAALKGRIFGKK